MSKQVQIGSNIYIIPEAKDNPGWGEDLTAFFEGIVAALANVQGPNDVLLTSATLSNNQVSPANVPGLIFNVSEVQGVEIDYFVLRIYDSGSSVTAERGKILGAFDGAVFAISTEAEGDAGIDFSITNGGQVQYVTTNLVNHISTVVRFKGVTIDSP